MKKQRPKPPLFSPTVGLIMKDGNVISIRITRWNDNHSWTDWSGHAKAQLVNRLKEYGDLPLTKTKRLVRQMLDRECITIKLPKSEGAEGIRHVLESLGAEVVIEKNQIGLNYCCDRFEESVAEGKFLHSAEPDETEWFMPEWLHIYFCPFCGASIKGKGFGNYDELKGGQATLLVDKY